MKLAKKKKMKTISARIDGETYERLQDVSGDLEVPMSLVVENALGFLFYCIDKEDEDEDVKAVMQGYFGDEDEDDDYEDYEDGDEDE